MASRSIPALVSFPLPPEIMEALMDEAERRGIGYTALARAGFVTCVLSPEKGLDFSKIDIGLAWRYTSKKNIQELRDLLARTSGWKIEPIDIEEDNTPLPPPEPPVQPYDPLPDRIPRKW